MTQVKHLKLVKQLKKKPIRKCYTMHECCICHKIISCGEIYRDGGYGKRAHEKCFVGIQYLR